MADLKHFRLPDVGEGLTEAEIVSWKVKPGDAVKVNDIIVEIETAKSLVELPCPFAGTVAELLAEEGATVDVGSPIIAVEVGASSVGAAAGAPASGEEAARVDDMVPSPPEEGAVEPGLIGGPAPGGRTSVLVGYGPKTTEAKRRPRKRDAVADAPVVAVAHESLQNAFMPMPAPTPTLPPGQTAPVAPSTSAHPSVSPVADGPVGWRADAAATGPVKAKPPVRKLAKDLGVDLASVRPSGTDGVITRADVEAARLRTGSGTRLYTDQPSGEPAPFAGGMADGVSVGGETRIPVKGVRKMTAQAMVTSAFTAPHVTEWVSVDVTRTMRLVERLKTEREFRDVKVSPLLILAKAMLLAVTRNPAINAAWDEAAQEIVVKHYVNLGIAAATPRGLLVPNIKNAERLSLRQLAEAIGQLTATAREGKTQPAEMAGGTMTITNVGIFGVDGGTPILNPGESAILCFGTVRETPWVHKGKVKPRLVTQLSLSFDHRMIDGELGSRFLADIAAVLQRPETALLWA